MKMIRYTLLSDGSSDKMLIPIIDWLLYQHCSEIAVESSWADLGRLQEPPKTLHNKILVALDLYPCDLLFVHRDAEHERYEIRHAEICRELSKLTAPPAVCVIPVRMMEAWFLFEKSAIRKAAGNPHGSNPLNLPNVNSLENHPNPKKVLFNLIKDSSGRSGVRLKKLNLHKCAFLVSKYIDDFSPLRSLEAFQLLETELATTLMGCGWKAEDS
ncbi:MAG: hypothetical protein KKC76_15305 [Proteobacteria bacterium]|nr:hypothetical protein [Pseudomonadota bacterium]MBU4297703.1 hypothetical protein [Pseudomonadota bacterium]MCG2746473.1 hypothetical protein [Desulfobulbaceae bacterium]